MPSENNERPKFQNIIEIKIKYLQKKKTVNFLSGGKGENYCFSFFV